MTSDQLRFVAMLLNGFFLVTVAIGFLSGGFNVRSGEPGDVMFAILVFAAPISALVSLWRGK